MCAIVETGNINHGGKTVLQDTSHLVHTTSYGTRRVFAVADILQERSHLITFGATLGRNFIANAPHHNTRIITILMQHIYHITLRPLIEVTVIAVCTFGNIPFIERFQHHHESHFITKLHQFRRRHIMGSTDSITAHIFQHRKLAA